MNYYSEAIEIISNPDTDFKKLVIEIAKNNPKILVNNHNKIYKEPWQEEFESYLIGCKKIAAIKLYRQNNVGTSLVEAKEYVEKHPLFNEKKYQEMIRP